MTAAPSEELSARVADHAEWYHTLDLAPGVTTPGWFDTRPVVAEIPFPRDLRGARCLDIGTFDGFWAFTMERRGADEVVAIDLLEAQSWDWPATAEHEAVEALGRRRDRGDGFEIAARALDSEVVRHELSVYDLDPGVLGTFDFVYLGSLLLHLRNPIGALEAVRSVCRGTFLLLDAIHLPLTVRHPHRPTATLEALGRPWWFKPNQAALVRMVEAAGFVPQQPPRRVCIPAGAGQDRPGITRLPRLLATGEGRSIVFRVWVGDPHVAVLARPDGAPPTRGASPDR